MIAFMQRCVGEGRIGTGYHHPTASLFPPSRSCSASRCDVRAIQCHVAPRRGFTVTTLNPVPQLAFARFTVQWLGAPTLQRY